MRNAFVLKLLLVLTSLGASPVLGATPSLLSSGTPILSYDASTDAPALYGSFTGSGTWEWNGTWSETTAGNPQLMTAAGSLFYGSFAGSGIWEWNGASWSEITAGNPQLMTAAGSLFYGSFAGSGIWEWNGTSWSEITPGNPELMAAGGSLLYGSFAGSGVWEWNGTSWSEITPGNPELMTAAGSLWYGSFAGKGIWEWNGTSWSQITPGNPQLMTAAGSLLYASFAGSGVWEWNGTSWSQITAGNPQLMAAGGSLLYGSFAGSGIWEWNGTSWSQITAGNPASMVVDTGCGTTLDCTFGLNGVATAAIGPTGTEDGAFGVAIQPDGKVVVVGRSGDDFAVVRFNASGSLDTSFGSNGRVVTNVSNSTWPYTVTDEARGVVIQPDGKIVVAGFANALSASDGNGGDFAVVRYNANGSLDTTFSGDGMVVTTVGPYSGPAYAVALQADGKIVVGGRAGSPTVLHYDFALVRYNTDGSLDTTFDGDGQVLTEFGGQNDMAYALAIQSDGKIVAAGASQVTGTSSYHDFALARYNPDGSLDTSFSGDGKLTTPISQDPTFNDDIAWAVAIQPDGKIVAAGETMTPSYFALVRYNADGSLDSGFGAAGKVLTNMSPVDNTSGAYGVAVLPGGKIVVAGRAANYTNGWHHDFAIARYLSNGSLDPTFDGDGKFTKMVAPDGQVDMARALAVQPNGRVVAAGYADMGPPEYLDYDFAVIRF